MEQSNNANTKKHSLRALAVALAVLALTCTVLGFTPASAVFAARKVPIYRVNTPSGKVALTFDAAWGADKTYGILDLLDQYEIKCTFFLVSFWMRAHPEAVKEIALRGHEIGTHSATHPDMSKLSAEQIEQELNDSIELITSLTGRNITLFRAPFGAYNNTLLNVTDSLKLHTIQWDVDSLDWKGLTAGEIAIRTQKATSGSIILCHNNSDNILEAIPLIIEAVSVKGLTFVPVGELIYPNNYSIDSKGEQHSNVANTL